MALEQGAEPQDPAQLSVEAIARLHSEHHSSAKPLERAVEQFVGRLGNPSVSVALLVLIILWVGVNAALGLAGFRAVDPAPFAWLELFASVVALGIALLILATQRRDAKLAQQREHLTLQLAILSEQKLAKIIALIEEARRDSPTLHDRFDATAAAMSRPADPKTLGQARVQGR